MSSAFRQFLRNVTPRLILRRTIDGIGAWCAGILITEHFYTIQRTEGPSMYPTLLPRGEAVLISRYHDHGKDVQVGDVIRFAHPNFMGVQGAKRVIGMPGDFVCKDPAFSADIGGSNEMIQVPEGHVFVAGDNLSWSRDSRNYGPVPMGLIKGKIVARVWPPSRMAWVENSLQTHSAQ